MTPILRLAVTLPSRLVAIGTMIVARFSEPNALWSTAWNVIGSESRTTIASPNQTRYAAACGTLSARRAERHSPIRTWLALILITACFLTSASQPAAALQFQVDIDQFNRWIFSSMQNPENARKRLNDRVEMEIHRIELTTDLRADQKAKIRLASKGDIKRFFDDVADAQRQFKEMQAEGEINQGNMNEVYQLAMPLQRRLSQGLFSKDSLLRKTARACVDDLQAKMLRERDEQLLQRRTQAIIKYVIANMNRQIPMLHRQREQLTNLLNDKVKIKDPSNVYSTNIVLFRLSELPREKITAIFDETQMKAIETQFAQAAAMQQQLKQMGVLDDE